jgi:hypothetical protein
VQSQSQIKGEYSIRIVPIEAQQLLHPTQSVQKGIAVDCETAGRLVRVLASS